MVSSPDGYAPAEAIIGGFAVGPDGQPTCEYARNPGHGPARDDFTRLQTSDHWLGWLPDTPARPVRSQFQAVLAGQVPGSVLDWVKKINEPAFLTTDVRSPTNPKDPRSSKFGDNSVHSWSRSLTARPRVYGLFGSMPLQPFACGRLAEAV